MTFEMTLPEASDLARFIERLRKRLPGDDWHKPGIENALGTARHRANATDLALAAIRAAGEPSNRTPAVIGMDGAHWKEASKPPRPEAITSDERCSVCSEHHDKCRSVWRDDHDFESTAVAAKRKAEGDPVALAGVVAALKAEVALTPKREPAPTGGLEALADRDPKLRARVDALRDALPKPPPMREPTQEPAADMTEPEPEQAEAEETA